MTENNENKMQKMDLDDLAGVAGGLTREAVIQGGIKPARVLASTVAEKVKGTPGAPSMSAGANDLAGIAMPVTPTVGSESSQPLTMMLCPSCGKMTEHLVFSGGRQKCKVCGHMQGLMD